MRNTLLAMVVLFCSVNGMAQTDNPRYNKALADSLGADEYGMKMYVLVILKTGSKEVEKNKRDSIFQGHMKNIGNLVATGKLVVAGPLGKNEKQYEGIFVLNASTVEEAKKLTGTDPAIQSGLLDVELFPWYGSAALPMYLKFHEVVGKKTF